MPSPFSIRCSPPGCYLAMSGAEQAVDMVDGALRDPSREAGLLRKLEKRLRTGIGAFLVLHLPFQRPGDAADVPHAAQYLAARARRDFDARRRPVRHTEGPVALATVQVGVCHQPACATSGAGAPSTSIGSRRHARNSPAATHRRTRSLAAQCSLTGGQAVGERVQERHDVLDVGIAQRGSVARMPAKGRLGVDIARYAAGKSSNFS